MGTGTSEYPTIVRFAGLGLALAGFAGLGYALLLVGFGFLYGESLLEQGLVVGLIDYVDAFALVIIGLRLFRRRPNAVRLGWLLATVSIGFAIYRRVFTPRPEAWIGPVPAARFPVASAEPWWFHVIVMGPLVALLFVTTLGAREHTRRVTRSSGARGRNQDGVS
jgi:hypothetical protein